MLGHPLVSCFVAFLFSYRSLSMHKRILNGRRKYKKIPAFYQSAFNIIRKIRRIFF